MKEKVDVEQVVKEKVEVEQVVKKQNEGEQTVKEQIEGRDAELQDYTVTCLRGPRFSWRGTSTSCVIYRVPRIAMRVYHG